MEGDGAGDQILFHQIQTQQIHHFLDDETPFVERVVAVQHLSAGETVGVRAVSLDIRDSDWFPAPGVVDQKLRVYSEQVIQEVFISGGDIAHGADTKGVQPSGSAGADAPEICQGLVRPESFPVAFLGEFSDKVIGMFGGNIQSHLRQIQIRAYAAGGADAGLLVDILHDAKAQRSGRETIEGEIIRHIHKDLVDGIDMDIFPGNIFQIDRIDICGNVHIFLHAGRCHNVIHRFWDLKDAAAVFNAQRFHSRGDCQADGLFCPGGIRHHQIGRHGIQASGHALYRGIKRF